MRSKTRLFAALFSVAVFGLVVDIDLSAGSGPQEVSAAVADELVGGVCKAYLQYPCGNTTGPNKDTCPQTFCWRAFQSTNSVQNQQATGSPLWCGGTQDCIGAAFSAIQPCNSGSSGGGGGGSSSGS